ncbi:MAG TPA: hypothetical protein VFL29_06185 [Candidatus Dormibacteraeota bacterium]|nr:hypothetical protein [Candidatus Dormibacteraeota bacterium]
MGLRLAAVVTVAVIAIALVAAYLAGQRLLVGGVPAGSSSSIAAYQALVVADHGAWTAATSNCQTLQAQACVAELAPDRAILAKWRNDVGSSPTPQRFAVINAQMKRHLDDLIQMFDTAIAAEGTGNQALYDKVAYYATLDSAWLGHAVQGISRSHLSTASQYTALVQAHHADFVSICSSFCPQDAAVADCAAIDDPLCPHDIITESDFIGVIQADFVETASPAEFSDQNSALQIDLAQADNALVAMSNALLHSDAAGLKAARASYADALVAVEADLQS